MLNWFLTLVGLAVCIYLMPLLAMLAAVIIPMMMLAMAGFMIISIIGYLTSKGSKRKGA